MWADCAVILVVDHPIKAWSDFTDPYGSLSYARLADARGRIQVGSTLFQTIMDVDPKAVDQNEDAVAFVFSIIGLGVGSDLIRRFLDTSASDIFQDCRYEGPDSLPDVIKGEPHVISLI